MLNSLPETFERDRLAALRRYGVMDTPTESAFEQISNLAASIFDVPIAVVSLLDDRRQWFQKLAATRS